LKGLILITEVLPARDIAGTENQYAELRLESEKMRELSY